MKKTLILATVAGVSPGSFTIVVLNIGSFGPIPFALWPIFAAWATFFMVGANGVGSRRGYIQLTCGILLSLILMSGYMALKLNDPLFIWLGLLVFILAWGLVALSGLRPELSFSPARLRRRGDHFRYDDREPHPEPGAGHHWLADPGRGWPPRDGPTDHVAQCQGPAETEAGCRPEGGKPALS